MQLTCTRPNGTCSSDTPVGTKPARFATCGNAFHRPGASSFTAERGNETARECYLQSTSYLEDLIKVRRLSNVRDVEHSVRPLLPNAMPNGGKIRGRVHETAVGLLHDERLAPSIPGLVACGKPSFGPVAQVVCFIHCACDSCVVSTEGATMTPHATRGVDRKIRSWYGTGRRRPSVQS